MCAEEQNLQQISRNPIQTTVKDVIEESIEGKGFRGIAKQITK